MFSRKCEVEGEFLEVDGKAWSAFRVAWEVGREDGGYSPRSDRGPDPTDPPPGSATVYAIF